MEHHTDAVSSHRTDWPMFITTVLGNYALNLEMTGALGVTGLIKTAGEAQAITAVISSLPWGTLVLATC